MQLSSLASSAATILQTLAAQQLTLNASSKASIRLCTWKWMSLAHKIIPVPQARKRLSPVSYQTCLTCVTPTCLVGLLCKARQRQWGGRRYSVLRWTCNAWRDQANVPVHSEWLTHCIEHHQEKSASSPAASTVNEKQPDTVTLASQLPLLVEQHPPSCQDLQHEDKPLETRYMLWLAKITVNYDTDHEEDVANMWWGLLGL